ncbi:MAG TPA: type II toxin-antitoxin system VapC family toxin [Mesorhizobium sp.]|jgi:PIN domain nuclease of toxin-antitoxin system|nr:type II toxin-antitoxin system VapC family toxin [Mesorhizobium sp.]
MRLLFDTHVVLEIIHAGLLDRPSAYRRLRDEADQGWVSVTTLWEITIKTRLGKLDPRMPVGDLAAYLESVSFATLDITRHHAVAFVEPEPATRDPFDRMLLAQCKVEGLKLVTVDRALFAHPLALPV